MILARAPIELFSELDSTNQEAARRAAEGRFGPVWLRAERQTAGRGRRGRSWATCPGNLFVTYLGASERLPGELALLGFAAGIAMAETVEALLGPGRASLKWPNDLLLDGAKAGGILLESGAIQPGMCWFALGLGVNLAEAPRGLEQPVASLATLLGHAIPADLFFAQLEPGVSAWAARLEQEGFAPLREAWLRRAYRLGETIQAEVGLERRSGVFAGLSASGELLLQVEGERSPLRVAAGDIFFPRVGAVS